METKCQSNSKIYLDLLDLIDRQEQVILRQNEIIVRLVNETAEQEAVINSLMQERLIWR